MSARSQRFRRQRNEALTLLAELTDTKDVCFIDDEGSCQAHQWFGAGQCPVARAKSLLASMEYEDTKVTL